MYNQPRVCGLTWNLSITFALNIWKVNKGLSYQILQSSFRTFTYIKLQLCEKVLLKEIYFYSIFMLFLGKITTNVFYVICGILNTTLLYIKPIGGKNVFFLVKFQKKIYLSFQKSGHSRSDIYLWFPDWPPSNKEK